jgi:hypothetical protein
MFIYKLKKKSVIKLNIMKQLKYVRHIIDTIPRYKYSPYIPKINVNGVPANTTIVPVSGTMDSFYHSFLYLVFPEYKTADWETQQALVKGLKDHHRWNDQDFMLKLTNSFNINIIVHHRKGIREFKSVFDYITIFLYMDDMGQYYPMIINDQTYRIEDHFHPL